MLQGMGPGQNGSGGADAYERRVDTFSFEYDARWQVTLLILAQSKSDHSDSVLDVDEVRARLLVPYPSPPPPRAPPAPDPRFSMNSSNNSSAFRMPC